MERKWRKGEKEACAIAYFIERSHNRETVREFFGLTERQLQNKLDIAQRLSIILREETPGQRMILQAKFDEYDAEEKAKKAAKRAAKKSRK